MLKDINDNEIHKVNIDINVTDNNYYVGKKLRGKVKYKNDSMHTLAESAVIRIAELLGVKIVIVKTDKNKELYETIISDLTVLLEVTTSFTDRSIGVDKN